MVDQKLEMTDQEARQKALMHIEQGKPVLAFLVLPIVSKGEQAGTPIAAITLLDGIETRQLITLSKMLHEYEAHLLGVLFMREFGLHDDKRPQPGKE